MTAAGLAPVAARARIDVLDILRGIAILGIFYMNIPFMGQAPFAFFADVRSIGWTGADQITWSVTEVLLEGTQRCLLEFLFGAGMMVLAARAMVPDGPVAIADLYLRRNLWLLAFGLFDVFVLLWPGDILLIYALAALLLFPFRKLAAPWLVAIGLLFASFTAVAGGIEYVDRTALHAKVEIARAHQQANQPLTTADKDALAKWQEKADKRKPDAEMQKLAEQDRKARTAGASLTSYASNLWSIWLWFVGQGGAVAEVAEAFSAMLIGIALWKWRIIQGGHSTGFYAVLTLAAYGFGLTARWIGLGEVLAFAPIPKTIWFTEEFARLATGLGHLALVNLVVRTAGGRAVLAPFKAAGRMAFSLYFLQQIIGGFVLFAPFALGLWGKFGWAELAAIATAVIIFELILANLYMRFFVAGPLEWLWRSLAYVRWQPLLRRATHAANADQGGTAIA